jgi:hypothetical protein
MLAAKTTVLISLVWFLINSPVAGFCHLPSNFKSVTLLPEKVATTNPEKAVVEDPNEDERLNYRPKIVRRGNEFHSVTHLRNEPVFYLKRGIFDLFIARSGFGYTKILAEGGSCEYMEHLPIWFWSVTYYGTCRVE